MIVKRYFIKNAKLKKFRIFYLADKIKPWPSYIHYDILQLNIYLNRCR